MSRWLVAIARVLGGLLGGLVGLVVIQMMRLRRMEFLPAHPGFYVNRVVGQDGSDRSPLRMIVFGDSTTAGVGVDRAEEALPTRLAELVASDRGRRVHVTSYGWNGARLADLLHDQLPRALGPIRAGETQPVLPTADIVAIVIGANDATHRTPARRFRMDLRRLLAEVRRAAPAADLVLAGIPTFRGALRQVEPLMVLTDQFARPLRRAQREEAQAAGVAFADLSRDATPRMRRRRDSLSTDSFHPSAAGYQIWAEVISAALAREEPGEERPGA
ncbi:MAG: SGNH/GDSL hydrolase family protein [Chloroflexota bacterium]